LSCVLGCVGGGGGGGGGGQRDMLVPRARVSPHGALDSMSPN
jgi:hypothetical protein